MNVFERNVSTALIIHIFIYLYIICADHPISYNIITFRKQKRIFVHFMNTNYNKYIGA